MFAVGSFFLGIGKRLKTFSDCDTRLIFVFDIWALKAIIYQNINKKTFFPNERYQVD